MNQRDINKLWDRYCRYESDAMDTEVMAKEEFETVIREVFASARQQAFEEAAGVCDRRAGFEDEQWGTSDDAQANAMAYSGKCVAEDLAEAIRKRANDEQEDKDECPLCHDTGMCEQPVAAPAGVEIPNYPKIKCPMCKNKSAI